MELKYEWDKINEFNVEKPLCEIYTIFFFVGDKLRHRRSKYKQGENFITNLYFNYKIYFYPVTFSSQSS